MTNPAKLRRPLRWFWCFALLLSACEDSGDDLPEPRWFGEWISVSTVDGQRPCAGTIEYMDRYIEAIHEQIGEPVDRDLRAEYHWLPLQMDRSPCAPMQRACTDGMHVYAPVLVDEHELAHVAILSVWGRTVSLFEEGLAEALGSSRSSTYEVQAEGFAPARLLDGPLDRSYYDAAGAFVRALIDHHGFTAFGEFYRAVPMDAQPKTIHWEFERVFGTSMGEFADIFHYEQTHCVFDLPHWFGPVVPWESDERWSWGSPMTCDSAHVQGPLASYGDPLGVYRQRRVRTRVAIEMPHEGDYLVRTRGPAPIMQRAGACEQRRRVWLSSDSATIVRLQTGRYWIESTQAIDESRSFRMTIEPYPPAPRDTAH